MKKCYLLLLFVTSYVSAQIVNIPDANFKARLLAADNLTNIAALIDNPTYIPPQYIKIDTNNDGEIQYSEAALILYLNLSYANISDLTGIEAFLNLKNLSFGQNPMTSVNLSQNILLEKIDCFFGSLESLNVTMLPNLITLNCEKNSISILDVSLNTNLEELRAAGNTLSVIDVTQNTYLKNFTFNENLLSSINLLQNTALESVSGRGNMLTSINITQNPLLTYVSFANNQLTSIDISQNPLLVSINFDNNLLTTIDVSQKPLLQELTISNNQIADINLTFNPLLKLILVNNNNLTSIDISQNPNIYRLACSNNVLSSIDVSQNLQLKQLYCSNTTISNLNLSQNLLLDTLVCLSNSLTTLDLTNNVLLSKLDCTFNQLLALDLTHNIKLFELSCGYNQITSLDLSQNVLLWQVNILNNQLTYVNMKNGKYEGQLGLGGNPNLQYVCADEEQVATIQNILGSNVMVSSYCTFTPGGNYNIVTGTVTFDSNNNGCDINDIIIINNVNLSLTNGLVSSGTFPSSVNNDYSLYTTTGNHTLTATLENPTYFNITPSTTAINFPLLNNSTTTQNFCITPNGIHPDLEVVIVPITPARPGFDAVYKIVYKNKGNQTVGGTVSFTFNDAVLDFISATVVPNVNSIGYLSWVVAPLAPFQVRTILVTLNVNSPQETPAVNINDILTFNVNIGLASDVMMSDNSFVLNQTVVGSYDPNDITCLQGNTLPTSEIGKFLHYNIRFENTGTAPAENIVVKNTIDLAQYNIQSLQVMESSHPVTVKVTGNIAEFIFQGIDLDTGGHGNILIKLKTKPTLSNNLVINKAGIYFDYNFPIVTNDEQTVFGNLSNSDFNKEISIQIYPNPAQNEIHIKAENAITSIELYDIQGRLLLAKMSNQNKETMDLTNYVYGTYFVSVSTSVGKQTQKIIKK